MSEFTEVHREVLTALCDTVVPAIERRDDPDGFYARRASDVGVPQVLEQFLTAMPDDQRGGLLQLLDALAGQRFVAASQRSREQVLRNVGLLGPDAAAGVQALQTLTLFFHYGLPDPQTGQNPNWATFGYPGPLSLPPQTPKPITPITPEQDTTLEADVCIVGSGAGGGVMAGELAAKGLKVIVLETGGYYDDADFQQLEIPAYQHTYWRGGPSPTADLNLSIQAGSCLGGGTVINWTNSLRTKPWVREEWEREHGLEGLAGADFDRHLDAVWQRLSVTDQASDLNRSQQKMQQAADKLGWSFKTVTRNTDLERYTPETAGYMGFGDQTGAKRSTVKTYLQDAVDHGAEVVVRCWAERVTTEGGRATGVEAVYSDPRTGRSARVTVRAPQVVVAAGALESPALLLRSQIGGPAVGEHLRLHPCTATFGMHPEDLQSWWGAPHAGLVDEHTNLDGDGYGFLIEGAQYTTAVAASAIPFTTAREHKDLMARFKHGGTFIALLRDKGAGRVTIDHNGMAVPWYSLVHPDDVRHALAGLEAQVRLHVAAGAQQVVGLAGGVPTWRWGDDVDAYVERLKRIPLQAGGWRLFSAHQMGSCRMGTDPQTSVAGPYGELHDTKGVWIGDGSAFPTPSGTNPMITIMALARRNAEAVAAAAPAGVGAGAKA